MKVDRLKRLRDAMARESLDAMLVTSAVGISYMSGAADSMWALVSRKSSSIMPSRLSDYSVRTAASRPWRVLNWRDPFGRLLRALDRQNIRRLGFESGNMSVSYHDSLRRRIGGKALLVECREMIENLREIKDAGELEIMRRAGAISAEISRQLSNIVRAGRTERAVAAEIDRRMTVLGADGPAFDTIVLAGSRTTHPHGRPGERRFGPGDLCLVDFGAKLAGYCSDVTRVLCVPPVKDLMRNRYALVRRAYLAAEAQARHGVRCETVDHAARRTMGRLQERFIHGLGHGVGLQIHEKPRLASGEKQPLKCGSVVTIEPGVYFPGWGAIRLENTLVVESAGIRSLTGELPADLPAAGRGA